MTITQKIIEVSRFFRRRHGLTSRQINEGSCHVFARAIQVCVPGASVIWNEDYDHAYLRHRGRLYDAERPRGVRRYTQLPAIRRQRA